MIGYNSRLGAMQKQAVPVTIYVFHKSINRKSDYV